MSPSCAPSSMITLRIDNMITITQLDSIMCHYCLNFATHLVKGDKLDSTCLPIQYAVCEAHIPTATADLTT